MGKLKRGRPQVYTPQQHKARGSYRKDRHGSLVDFCMEKKPPGKQVSRSVRESAKWVRNVADERAVAEGYRFFKPLAEHVEHFFNEYVQHSDGEWSGKSLQLQPWQRDEIIYPMFGWVHPETGYRRFRISYIEIAKKQGKSFLASACGLYFLCADEEAASLVVSLGADQDQARVVHDEAMHMALASENLMKILKINKSHKSIAHEESQSIYRALSGSGRGKHGMKIHAAIADELHCWRGDELWEAIRYSFRSRRQPFLMVITNAGDDLQSICANQRDKAQALLDGNMTDHRFLSVIYSAKKEDALAEIESVRNGAIEIPLARKCNPSMGVITREEDVVADIKDAIQTPREVPNLLRLTYGVWEVSEDPWLDVENWKQNEMDEWDEDWTNQRDCWIGLDLSKTADTTAACIVYPDDEDFCYRMECHFWLPEETIERYSHLVPYREWESDGYITATAGNVCDYEQVLDGLKQFAEHSIVQNIHYDPWQAENLMQRFNAETGIPRKAFQQTITNYAEPSNEFHRLLLSHQIKIRKNKCFRYQASVVSVKPDMNNNIRPIKPESKEIRKIDGICAAIMGLSGAMSSATFGDTGSLVFNVGD